MAGHNGSTCLHQTHTCTSCKELPYQRLVGAPVMGTTVHRSGAWIREPSLGSTWRRGPPYSSCALGYRDHQMGKLPKQKHAVNCCFNWHSVSTRRSHPLNCTAIADKGFRVRVRDRFRVGGVRVRVRMRVIVRVMLRVRVRVR